MLARCPGQLSPQDADLPQELPRWTRPSRHRPGRSASRPGFHEEGQTWPRLRPNSATTSARTQFGAQTARDAPRATCPTCDTLLTWMQRHYKRDRISLELHRPPEQERGWYGDPTHLRPRTVTADTVRWPTSFLKPPWKQASALRRRRPVFCNLARTLTAFHSGPALIGLPTFGFPMPGHGPRSMGSRSPLVQA